MPPKTRGCKTTKVSSENTGTRKNKLKTSGKISKPSRKPLADKTNSASDDNESRKDCKFNISKTTTTTNLHNDVELNKDRPRRERKLPKRYIGNNLLNNLSNSQEVILEAISSTQKLKTPQKKSLEKSIVLVSPLPLEKNLDNSLIKNRPKRVCRLPSKFEDHTLSPSKKNQVQPVQSSTPIVQNKASKTIHKNIKITTVQTKEKSRKITPQSENITPESQEVLSKDTNKVPVQKKINDIFQKKNKADTNNNAKQNKIFQSKNSSSSSAEGSFKHSPRKRIIHKDFSFRVFEDKRKSLKRDSSKLDVYEFTFDPTEEPPPQKKKRKKAPAKKREAKPKVVLKSNYDRNLAKALASLKKAVSSKTAPCIDKDRPAKINPQLQNNVENAGTFRQQQNVPTRIPEVVPDVNIVTNQTNKSQMVQNNYNSVRVEDIALDFDNDIDYSPVNSPNRAVTPAPNPQQSPSRPAAADDPLHLRDDVSFFDDQPVASSSMNVSVRHPHASPWRVEFNNLPIKWQVNTYVKSNMTPAVESSFIDFTDVKKKHVYTDMVPETNDVPLLEEASSLKQTSIISFFKEVVEKKVKKKKDKTSPLKVNSLFEENTNINVDNNAEPSKALDQGENIVQFGNNVDNQDNVNGTDTSNEKESSKDISEDQNSSNDKSKSKTPKKKKDKDVTYFGFDDSENGDQENVSPVKKKNLKAKSLRPRARAVLQELNNIKGPMRAVLPVAVKSKTAQSSEIVNKLFDEMKSATEPPVLRDKAVESITNIESTAADFNDDDSQSVHLFEDIDLVHHTKPSRKSYMKAKKVAFRKNSDSDDSSDEEHAASSDVDNIDDRTFNFPMIKPKKTTKQKSKKKLRSKKEEKEAEEWAAGFNSMCEEIEEFDLLVV